ncbi:MAG TPA: electron transport complex subunit RsxD [Pseudomonadales bacterium]|nr:electron transport complex subunit RsxD [Pseudomonadales bacterium]
MSLIHAPSPQSFGHDDTSQMMRLVLLATLPGLLALTVFFGWGTLIICVLASIVALASESLVLYLRKRPIDFYLKDYSALVTAILLGLSLPPLSPWWIPCIGTAFAIVVGKHLYGGLGFNIFNPAMLGYAFLLVSFPVQMTLWLPPDGLTQIGFLETCQLIFNNHFDPASIARIDALSGATPLDNVRTELGLSKTLPLIYGEELYNAMLAGRGWEWVNIGFLLGGLFLIYKGIIHWQIPAALLLTLATWAFLMMGYDSDRYASPFFHLFSGGTMLGAFFIATDPVTAATSAVGRWIYGAFIGLTIYIIRTFGGYPDAVAFAVLLMNLAVPTIDYYTQPRSYGHEEAKFGRGKRER